MKIDDGPQDLDKLIGAGKDLWKSDEDFDEWMAMLEDMRHPERELQAELAETRGLLWAALEARARERDLLREMVENPAAQVVLIHRAQALLDRIEGAKA